jgi:hypothetical protein
MKNYSAKIALLSPMLFVLLIAACAKPNSTTNREAKSPTNSAASSASPAPTTSTATSNTGEIGVPECDAFLKALETCINDKVPALVRPTFESSLATYKKQFREQSLNPADRAALVTGCKSAHEQARTSFKDYGCSFE